MQPRCQLGRRQLQRTAGWHASAIDRRSSKQPAQRDIRCRLQGAGGGGRGGEAFSAGTAVSLKRELRKPGSNSERGLGSLSQSTKYMQTLRDVEIGGGVGVSRECGSRFPS